MGGDGEEVTGGVVCGAGRAATEGCGESPHTVGGDECGVVDVPKGATPMAPVGKVPADCQRCFASGAVCTWGRAMDGKLKFSVLEKHSACDSYVIKKKKCNPMVGSGAVSRGKKWAQAGTPSPCGKGKQRQASPSPMGRGDLYDDQAWVQAANDIMNKLSWTNAFLERSILMSERSVCAVEGSRAAMEQGVPTMEKFMEGQAHLQALLLRHFGSASEGSKSRGADYGVESAEEEVVSDVEIQEVQGPAAPAGGNEGAEVEVVAEAGVEEVAEAAEDAKMVM
ncbi:uncharacterized protein EDB91DRAFT_1080753 [Suillus paluster]|uniref:uncharacterized protein n=1 Tax=Suillus paluster TaxID=48578 RepID=UPI001B88167A|nr:uncharacterized protein EDB91DRAFT_1080753 [Suillus paluster]KAG1744663.1 hypothetical protein EDB91DRAFT_1080753 [Suillus paluster]